MHTGKTVEIFNRFFSVEELVYELMPFNEKTQLTSKNFFQVALRVRLVLRYMISSLISFDKKEYWKFDPHVGETSCQIRACMCIYIMKNKKIPFQLYINQLRRVELQIAKFMLEGVNKCTLLSEVLKQVEGSFEFSVLFLGASFMLSAYTVLDSESLPQRIDYEKFQEECELTKKFSDRLIHRLQIFLSHVSYEFIRQLALEMGQIDFAAQIFSSVKRGDENRYALPAYTTVSVICEFLIKEGALIALHVKHNSQVYTICLKIAGGSVVESVDFDADNLCFCIYGVSESALKFDQLKPKLLGLMQNLRLLYFNLAVHAQYPGARLLKENEKFELYSHLYFPNKVNSSFSFDTVMGNLLGCSKDDQALFLVKHIYASKAAHEFVQSNWLKKINSRISMVT